MSIPPRSARESASDTFFTPENVGLPRSAIILRAASVSSSRRLTSPKSSDGVSLRARSLASALTAWRSSRSKRRGSSSTRMDFSNSSLIVFSEILIPIRIYFDNYFYLLSIFMLL